VTAGCKAALPLVEKLADGESSPVETREAEAHLALCPTCREHLEALRAFATLSRESAPPEPPESYWEHLPRRILERIDSERLAPRSLWRRLLAPEMLRYQALVVSFLLLVAVGVTVFRSEIWDAPPPAATAPPLRQEPAPVVPRAPAAKDEAPTPDPKLRLEGLGYTSGTPPIARDQPAPEPPARASEPPSQAPVVSPRPPASAAAPEPVEKATGARETAADVAALSIDERRAPSEEDSFVLLKRKQEAEAGANLRSRGAANRALRAGPGDDSDACAEWRGFLESYGDEGTRGADARYELARCSLGRYEQAPDDSSRESAIADAEAFLERESDGPRADEIRRALEAVRDR
jgi:hypothetical protein